MNKYLIPIIFVILLVISCEKSDNNTDDLMNSTISILYPQNESDITCEECTIEVISIIENKESADLAYILIDNNIITSGLTDTLRAYYQPPSDWEQTINIEARLVNFLDDESIEIIASDNSIVNLNSIDINPSTTDPVFMNVNNQFSMMRFPVTNREFINFLNTNEYLDVEIVDVIWGDENGNNYGNPSLCHDRDVGDQYEPTEWWYVNVKTVFGNQDIPTEEYSIYKNGYNIYDINADYSNQGGKIQYDCLSQIFFLPDEQDGSESIFLDHPVTGVSWVGATIYAHHFGWTLPTLEQWEIAAKDDNNWDYPWAEDTITTNYANYNGSNTSKVGFYNGLGELNLSLSAFGLYDMAGNVWEHTSTSSVPEIYFKTGGAFDSDTTQLQIGYTGYSIFNQISNNTGFRCVTDINYPSSLASGCMIEDKCNYDIFAESSENCFIDDCLKNCGGNAIEIEFYQDLDGDGLGNPNISEIQCNEPQNGWVDNTFDLDDTCSSIDINQDNIDCDSICNGNAFIDGCGNCVGGETGETECNEDCNGVNGGSAERDDCDVCSGGDTGLEPNQDLDCNGVCNPLTPQGEEDLNNGLEYGAFIDNCQDCVGGGTGLEENYADLGCGCDEPEAKTYCLDTNNNGCCDCGNDSDGNWDECSSELDAEFICENDLSENNIETILGCSNNNAENWYCDENENECIAFGVNVIPPCYFIDDGSCIIYGCSDPIADNYWNEATECSDGSIDNCCEYTAPIQLSFGSVDSESGTMEIDIIVPEYDDESGYIYGFQFNVDGANLTSASGGLAEQQGFTVSVGGSTVIGFSFSGTYIGQGAGILTTLQFSPTSSQACLNLGTGAFSNQNSQPIPVEFGDCYEF